MNPLRTRRQHPENKPKAAKARAAEKVDDPTSPAVGAKVEARVMQSIQTTQGYEKRQERKYRWKDTIQRTRCLQRYRKEPATEPELAVKCCDYRRAFKRSANPNTEETWSAHEASSWSWNGSYGYGVIDRRPHFNGRQPLDLWEADLYHVPPHISPLFSEEHCTLTCHHFAGSRWSR